MKALNSFRTWALAALTLSVLGTVALSQSGNVNSTLNTVIGIDYPSTLRTYSAGHTFVPAAGALDIFTITGSATRTIKVREVRLALKATTSVSGEVLLMKRSTANSGGTSTNVTEIPLDSGFGAATATVLSYTANPTGGTLVGEVLADQIMIGNLTTTQNVPKYYSFGMNGSPVVLRGITQVLAVSLAGVTYSGNVASAYMMWTEE